MKTLKISAIACAVCSLLSTPTFADNTVDFHGYARAGVSTTSKGGEQMCFGNGADGHYTGRLGDECESYYELGLGHAFTALNGKSFYFDSMFSAETSQGAQYNDNQPITEPGSEDSRGDFSLRQLNLQAKGLLDFAPEATVWAGKRFYQRHQVYMMDLYYLNNSGYGAGVEGIHLGSGDLSVAVVTGDRSPYNGKTNAEGEQSVQTQKFDVRYSHIPLWEQAELEFAFIYGRTDVTEIQENADEAKEDGVFITAELNHKIAGANNTLVLQYANDSMADAAWTNASGSAINTDLTWEGENDNAYRVINYGDVRLSDKVNLDYSLLYAKAETLAAAGDVSENEPYRFSFILKPSYAWSDYSKTTLELGYTSYKDSDDTETQKLQKIMIAQQFTYDFGFKTKPTISFYAGSFFGNVAENYRYGSDDGEDGNYRLGAHIEAWW